MQAILPYVQIALSVVLIGLILLQQSDASVGAAFGGDSLSSNAHTRRGPEKFLFYTTIIVGILFAVSALAALIMPK